MRVDAFDFDLPPERIALRPAEPREAARLLVVRPGLQPELRTRGGGPRPSFAPVTAVVVNDTKVIRRGLTGRGPAMAAAPFIWSDAGAPPLGGSLGGVARPAKRLVPGDRIRFGGKGAPARPGR